jgi:hypothetical protein
MIELQRIHLRGAPLHAAIGRAFDEVNARHRWKAHDVFHGENERTLDQTMDHQPVLIRIDVRPACMMALEKQAVRCDDAMQVLQRRKADGRFGPGRQPWHVAPDAPASARKPAMGPINHAGPDRPRCVRGRRSPRGPVAGLRAECEAGQRGAQPEKRASFSDRAHLASLTPQACCATGRAARSLALRLAAASFVIAPNLSSLANLVNAKQ